MASVRPAAIAGMFYARDARVLALDVDGLMAAARVTTAPLPKAIIAPHAGYIYSGPVAASIYALIALARARIKRVVLHGPTHRVTVHGMALPGVNAFATPLGHVAIDGDNVKTLMAVPFVGVNAEAHRLEHSLGVQLPLLQTILGGFMLTPLALERARSQQVAEVIDRLLGGDKKLIVVSSDLSHYLPYAEAQTTDRATAQAIVDLHSGIDHQQACGATPVAGLNVVARQRGLGAKLIDLRDSGDTAGDKARVAGYGSFAYYAQQPAAADGSRTH